MEPQPKNQIGESLSTAQPPQDTTALEIIRTETVLSKLPVHNLAKKGKVNIQILKTAPDGNVELKWEVSYNERYGQARQLPYKLDTIVIDRHVEEIGRPLPERLRLGSLREIAEELGIEPGDTATLKKAFHQNAGTYITAKLKYRANDGTEHTFEAGFTRYTVIFTGQKFSDGTKADSVYIDLHPRYREVLNNAPVRPLNLAYKKQLAPAAQRFYEIVSYKIFTALKYNHPKAKQPYSEYCTFSAQQRYLDYDHFKKQMYKIHRPHLQSGYLAHVDYEPATDQQGSADWIMCYVPGPKARAEYETFTGKRTRVIDANTGAGERPPRARTPRQKSLLLVPEVDPTLLAELTKRGIGPEKTARKLLAATLAGQRVMDQIEYWDFLNARTTRPEERKGTGLLVDWIRNNYTPPDNAGFISSRQQKERVAARQAKDELAQQNAAAEQAYDAFVRSRLEAHLQTLPAGEYERLITAELDTLMRQYPKVIRETIKGAAEAAVRRSLTQQLHLPTFEQWKRQPPTSPAPAAVSPVPPDVPPPEPLPMPTHKPLPTPEPQPQPEPTPTKPSITNEAPAAEPPPQPAISTELL